MNILLSYYIKSDVHTMINIQNALVIITSITCTCRYYFCYAMCSHLYAASELYNLSLIPQNKVKAKKFVFRVAKSKKSLLDKTQQLVVESIALNKRTVRNNELISQSNVEAVVEPVQPKVTRSLVNAVTKKNT
jgi:hypothetical protein